MKPLPTLSMTAVAAAWIAVCPLLAVSSSGAEVAAPCARVDDAEEEAAELLAQAEEIARKGRYKDARAAYEKIAKKYAGTHAGGVAERRTKPSAFVGWDFLVESGPSANRVDVVIFGEAYELKNQKGFDKLAATIPDYFERTPTYEEYLSYFNFIRGNLVSQDGHVDGFGREFDTALGGRTGTTDAGHVGVEKALVLQMLDELPAHDSLAVVITRDGVFGTGWDGVATVAANDLKIMIHEFGHGFVGLGDEYATHTHKRGDVVNWINVAASEDPALCPWKHWLDAKVKGIGLYEGADGQVRGAWKPTSAGCVMGDGQFFCRVCREAIVLRIYSLVDPIDACTPEPHLADTAGSLPIDGEIAFEVVTLQPANHPIEVTWWVLPEAGAPRSTPGSAGGAGRYGVDDFDDRRSRGPLPAIHAKEADTTKARNGVHRFRVRASDLEPGRYRVVARARDTTLLRGDKLPWVLKDERGVLESERAWWVTVE